MITDLDDQNIIRPYKVVTQFQDPKYWDKLEESDKKTWSNYMIHRFLSMNPDWIETISEIQPFTQTLEPKQLYQLLIGLLLKRKVLFKIYQRKERNKIRKFLIGIN